MFFIKNYWQLLSVSLICLGCVINSSASPTITGMKDSSKITKVATIRVTTTNIENRFDSLKLKFWIFYPGKSSKYKSLVPVTHGSKSHQDTFRFQITPSSPLHYFNIEGYLGGKAIVLIEERLLEPGDDFSVRIHKDSIEYTGRGYEKNVFLEEASNLVKTRKEFQRTSLVIEQTAESIKSYLDYQSAIQKFKIGHLLLVKEKLSATAFNILMADIIGETEVNKYSQGSFYFTLIDNRKRKIMMDLYFSELYRKPLVVWEGACEEDLALSGYYYQYLLQRQTANLNYEYLSKSQSLDEFINWKKRKSSEKDNIEIVISQYQGLMRDKIVFDLLLNLRMTGIQDNLDFSLSRAADMAATGYFRTFFRSWKGFYSRGSRAIDFEFEDTLGKKVRLSDFKGKVVLIDLWFSGCGACRIISEAMPEVEKVFSDRSDLIFLSVSIDSEKNKWLKSISKYSNPDVINPFAGKHYSGENTVYLYTGGKGTNDEFIKRYVSVGYPVLLIIDRDGNIENASPSRPKKGMVEDLVSDLYTALEK